MAFGWMTPGAQSLMLSHYHVAETWMRGSSPELLPEIAEHPGVARNPAVWTMKTWSAPALFLPCASPYRTQF